MTHYFPGGNDPPASDPDSVTVLRAEAGELRKVCRAGRPPEPAAMPKWVTPEGRAVRDLDALAELIAELLDDPTRCVVRAEPLPGIAWPARRLLHPDPATGDPATFCDVPRRWLALDFDDVPVPFDDWHRDVFSAGTELMALLPPALWGAGAVAVASGSAGIKPGVRLRLWLLLAQPLTADEARRALVHVPLDRSALRPTQVVFTAAPKFVGTPDPVTRRLAVLPGPRVTLPVPPPERPPPRPTRSGPRPAAGLSRVLDDAARATSGQRHELLHRAAFILGLRVASGGLALAEAEALALGAAEASGVARDDRHIGRFVARSLRKGLNAAVRP